MSVCLSVGLNSAEVYDPNVNEWRYITSMSTRRSSVGVGVVTGQSPYICLYLSVSLSVFKNVFLSACFSSFSPYLSVSVCLSLCLCMYESNAFLITFLNICTSYITKSRVIVSICAVWNGLLCC